MHTVGIINAKSLVERRNRENKHKTCLLKGTDAAAENRNGLSKERPG